ncbi:MAG: hypothetical protein R6U27_09410 [Desulfobacterales bacterium]
MKFVTQKHFFKSNFYAMELIFTSNRIYPIEIILYSIPWTSLVEKN